jgi:hypothetical protein
MRSKKVADILTDDHWARIQADLAEDFAVAVQDWISMLLEFKILPAIHADDPADFDGEEE